MRLGTGLAVLLASTAMAASLLTAVQLALPGGSAEAHLDDFDPGNIISDEVFFDPNTMTASQIQSFLDSKVSTCASGAACLKNYRETTPTGPPANQRYEGDSEPNCRPYQGAKGESAAQIIAKVSQACGINPQVILVTLQKEQGLVTKSKPTASNWLHAMGYACPDSGSCDKNYNGFFNQVYEAMWQFKQYSIQDSRETSFTYYDPGTNPRIYYNPEKSCGSDVVKIKNQATANLYYYTPYQPNRSALAAGYGVATGKGSSCASYGNRNFYNYFTDWFGSTHSSTVAAGLSEALQRADKSGKNLGKSAGPVMIEPDGGASQKYEKGTVYQAPGSKKAYYTVGGVDTTFSSLGANGGVLGYPTGEYTDVNKTDRSQTYQHGAMYYTKKSGVRYVLGEMADAYAKLHGISGTLGRPVGDPIAPSEGTQAQRFAEGTLYWSLAGGGHYMLTDMAEAYRDLGGVTGPYGFPVEDTHKYKNGVLGQRVERAMIYWSSSGGAWAVSGGIQTAYSEQGGPDGALGYPTSGATTGDGGTRTQHFAHGSIAVAADGEVTVSK